MILLTDNEICATSILIMPKHNASFKEWLAGPPLVCACGCGKSIPRTKGRFYRRSKSGKHFLYKHQMRGHLHWKWRGGVIFAKGYIWIKNDTHYRATPRGYVKRAVLVAEQKLGRRLRRNEIVHHRNHIKTNDTPSNIEVLKNQTQHMALHQFGVNNGRYRFDVDTARI